MKYQCESCGFASSDVEDVNKCEKQHSDLLEQCEKVSNEVIKFYEMGGKLELFFGSADGKELGDIIFSTDKKGIILNSKQKSDKYNLRRKADQMGEGVDKLLFKDWTTGCFRNLIKKFNRY